MVNTTQVNNFHSYNKFWFPSINKHFCHVLAIIQIQTDQSYQTATKVKYPEKIKNSKKFP